MAMPKRQASPISTRILAHAHPIPPALTMSRVPTAMQMDDKPYKDGYTRHEMRPTRSISRATRRAMTMPDRLPLPTLTKILAHAPPVHPVLAAPTAIQVDRKTFACPDKYESLMINRLQELREPKCWPSCRSGVVVLVAHTMETWVKLLLYSTAFLLQKKSNICANLHTARWPLCTRPYETDVA